METGTKILIAEDEKPLRDHLANLLQEVWPEANLCAQAENGRQVVDLVRRHHPRVAFLDIKMPGLNGMQAARKSATNAISSLLPPLTDSPWKLLSRKRWTTFSNPLPRNACR